MVCIVLNEKLSRLTRRFSGISWQIAKKKKIVTRACLVENRRICSFDIIVQMSFSCKRSVTRTSIACFSLSSAYFYVRGRIDRNDCFDSNDFKSDHSIGFISM